MIEISPAILTSEIVEFQNQLNELTGFKSIDIDVIRHPFVDNTTLQIQDVVNFLEKLTQINFGFHLMVEFPLEDLEFLKASFFKDRNLRIYIHQEAEISKLDSFGWPELWQRGITVKLESELREISYYQNYPEVQLMSIKTGWQGGKFDSAVLQKVEFLRKNGFTGKISLDGGVNLETAQLIKDSDINRVSVGSLFSKSHEDRKIFEELNNILNSTM